MKHIQYIVLLLVSFSILGCPTKPADKSGTKSEPSEATTAQFQQGQDLFESNCSDCHNAPSRHYRDGTIWNGLFNRFAEGEQHVQAFICSSSTLRKDSDAYALAIQEAYGYYGFEHEFCSTMSPEELSSLIVFLKQTIAILDGDSTLQGQNS